MGKLRLNPLREGKLLINLLTWKPMWVCWPDAMYFPDLETYITEMSLSCPYKTICMSQSGCERYLPSRIAGFLR